MNMLLSVLFLLSVTQISWGLDSPFDYCSYEGQELDKNRYIPPRIGTTEMSLHQVQSIIRHGARTPASQKANSCFPKMRNNPIEWDCSYYETFSGSDKNSHESLTLDFGQHFDAQPDQSELLGTCRMGQLTIDATPQIQALANSFYNAYFNENPIFQLEDLMENPELLYLRSTDIQRTRHTNAGVITKMISKMEESQGTSFKGKMTLHLVDNAHDEMSGGNTLCENFDSIMNDLTHTKEYKELLNKNKIIHDEIKTLQGKTLNPLWFWTTLDCYMSLLCHEKQDYLPEELKLNSSSDSQSFGYKLYDVFEKENAYFTLANDAVLSKCISKQFVKNFINGFDVNEHIDKPDNDPKSSKFALFAAHDSTLVYFLSSIKNLFDEKWPTYASMVVFEIYKDSHSESYFRIIYNGNEITDKIEGCQDSSYFINEGVCPFEMLLKATNWIHANGNLAKSIIPKETNGSSEIVLALLFIAGFVTGIISMISIHYMRRFKHKRDSKDYSFINEVA